MTNKLTNGISDPVLRRLAQKAGIKTLSSLSYEEIRGNLMWTMQTFLKKCKVLVDHQNRKTILPEDIKRTIELFGEKMYTHDETMKKCKVAKVKGKNKYVKEIRHYQAQSDCLYIPQVTFKRQLDTAMNRMNWSASWNKLALQHVQLFFETQLVRMLAGANKLAIHAQRQTVEPKDIALWREITGDKFTSFDF